VTNWVQGIGERNLCRPNPKLCRRVRRYTRHARQDRVGHRRLQRHRLATARAFAHQCTRVVIASRDERMAKRALDTLAKAGGVQWMPADVADSRSVSRLITAVIEKHGRLDYAFNNGGNGGRFAPRGLVVVFCLANSLAPHWGW